MLIINTKTQHENANANLWFLKCDVKQYVNGNMSYKKIICERIEIELNNINVEKLGFNHLICSKVLNIKSKSFINIFESFCDIFIKTFQKYKLK